MAYLLLSNGTVFEGKRFGAKKDTVGEIVFTTGVVGYPETLTDPAYAGQIIVQTFPLIGNCGIIPEDLSGDPLAAGYVVRELCRTPSNFRCEGDLESYLEKKGIAGIEGIDTRELTRIIRSEGTMNAIICDELPEDMSVLEGDFVKAAAESFVPVSGGLYLREDRPERPKYSVGVINLGNAYSIIETLTKMDCGVYLFERDVAADTLLKSTLDGIVFSDGPGDPSGYKAAIEAAKAVVGKMPVLGISLGHQVIALAKGGRVSKMKYGHRGGQPVKTKDGKRTLITSQNHGFVVDSGSMKGIGEVVFTNANDGSCEGINYKGKKCFTVQFSPFGRDAAFVFDKFISMMGGDGNAER